MSDSFNKFTSGMGKALETVPTLYEDGLQPAIREAGKALAIIPQTVNAALIPLRKWNIEREYNFSETQKLLAKKLENIEPQKIVTPDTFVAIPALQAISYSMDSEELRNLYANLLAKSMNIDTKEFVHPSFVEIIKQMSPYDVNFFSFLAFKKDRPIVDVLVSSGIEGYLLRGTHCTMFEIYDQGIRQVCIDNLLRLGLINIPSDFFCTDTSIYIPLEKQVKEEYIDSFTYDYPIEAKFKFVRGAICFTDFGNSFIDTCVSDFSN